MVSQISSFRVGDFSGIHSPWLSFANTSLASCEPQLSAIGTMGVKAVSWRPAVRQKSMMHMKQPAESSLPLESRLHELSALVQNLGLYGHEIDELLIIIDRYQGSQAQRV